MLYENGEFERIRPHLTPLECGIIFDAIPEGAISRKVGLIWGIPGYDLKGVPRALPPYRLPELLAADPDQLVFLVEGEKDADRLRALGLMASTTAMGAGSARQSDLKPLKGRNVVLLEDNDIEGHQYVTDVAALLPGIAASVRLTALPGLPEHGDVSDWLDAGHTFDELQELAASASG